MGDWRLTYGGVPSLMTWIEQLFTTLFGVGHLVVEFVRFSVLWLFYALTYLCARALLGDDRLAATAGLAPFAVYMVGWELLFRQNDSVMLLMSIPATLYVLILLDRQAKLSSFLLFGLVTALGLLSKYNYAIFWFALVLAALSDEVLRKRFLDKRMLLSLGVALVILSPLILRHLDNIDGLLGKGKRRLMASPSFESIPAAVSASIDLLLATLGILVPLVLIVAIFVPRGLGPLPRTPVDQGARYRRLLQVSLCILFGLMLAGIFAFEISRLEQRYIYVLMLFVPYLFLRIAAARPTIAQRRGLATALAASALFAVTGTAIRNIAYPYYH
jgi:4-amino-4-deoxy-L-arabinose transferase-like glycosyltransferase